MSQKPKNANLMKAFRDAEAASGEAWHSASEIHKLLPEFSPRDLHAALARATQMALLEAKNQRNTVYAIRKRLNNLEQQSYDEILATCNKLRRPVQSAEVETCNRGRVGKNLSRLVYKGFLQKDGNFYAPTLQTVVAREDRATVARPPWCDAKTRANKQPAPIQNLPSPKSELQVSPQPTPFAARLKALAAAFIALFVR